MGDRDRAHTVEAFFWVGVVFLGIGKHPSLEKREKWRTPSYYGSRLGEVAPPPLPTQ